MKLNEMSRALREPNFSKLRSILRDPKHQGDPIFAYLLEHSDEVGISQNSMQMVYEGFWDIYCKKPATTDWTAKKLAGWENFVNLRLPLTRPFDASGEQPPAEGDDENELSMAKECKAIVRVRVPMEKPAEPNEEEDAKSQGTHTARSHKSGRSGKSSKKPEAPKEIADIEDRVLAINPQGDTYQIHVLHQYAQRQARKHIALSF